MGCEQLPQPTKGPPTRRARTQLLQLTPLHREEDPRVGQEIVNPLLPSLGSKIKWAKAAADF